MKKLYKYLVALGLSVALLLSPTPCQQEVRAQGMPTIDLSNLLQNILSWLSDQDLVGAFTEGVDGSVQVTEWMNKLQKMREVLQYLEYINKGARYATEIINISKLVTQDLELAKNMVQYFAVSGCPYSYKQAAEQCYTDYANLVSDLMNSCQERYTQIISDKAGDKLAVLAAVDSCVDLCVRQYYQVSSKNRNRLRSLYVRERRLSMGTYNHRFTTIRIY